MPPWDFLSRPFTSAVKFSRFNLEMHNAIDVQIHVLHETQSLYGGAKSSTMLRHAVTRQVKKV